MSTATMSGTAAITVDPKVVTLTAPRTAEAEAFRQERRYYRVGGLDHDLAAMRSWSDGHRAMRQRERDEAANNELSAFRRVLKLL